MVDRSVQVRPETLLLHIKSFSNSQRVEAEDSALFSREIFVRFARLSEECALVSLLDILDSEIGRFLCSLLAI